MPEQKTVRTSVLEIAYLESGPADGPPVILLHGWPSDVHDWDGVAPPLAQAGFRVLVPWLRGFGPTRFLNAATRRAAGSRRRWEPTCATSWMRCRSRGASGRL